MPGIQFVGVQLTGVCLTPPAPPAPHSPRPGPRARAAARSGSRCCSARRNSVMPRGVWPRQLHGLVSEPRQPGPPARESWPLPPPSPPPVTCRCVSPDVPASPSSSVDPRAPPPARRGRLEEPPRTNTPSTVRLSGKRAPSRPADCTNAETRRALAGGLLARGRPEGRTGAKRDLVGQGDPAGVAR